MGPDKHKIPETLFNAVSQGVVTSGCQWGYWSTARGWLLAGSVLGWNMSKPPPF